MDDTLNRRHLLAGTLPAATLLGSAVTGGAAIAQDRDAAGARRGFDSVVERLIAQAYQNGRYTLPPLPYPYDALEPHIDARTMRLHHDQHHLGYVNGLNRTLDALEEFRRGTEKDSSLLYALQRDLTFNGGGHTLHTLFWATMAPRGGGTPRGEIAQALNRQFGSFSRFKEYYTSVATGVKGSGWAVLAYEPVGDMLDVFQVGDHDTKLIATAEPLLPLDVWEHAYYLKYTNNRGRYVDAWWNVVNWPAVNDAYTWVRSRFRERQARASG